MLICITLSIYGKLFYMIILAHVHISKKTKKIHNTGVLNRGGSRAAVTSKMERFAM